MSKFINRAEADTDNGCDCTTNILTGHLLNRSIVEF